MVPPEGHARSETALADRQTGRSLRDADNKRGTRTAPRRPSSAAEIRTGVCHSGSRTPGLCIYTAHVRRVIHSPPIESEYQAQPIRTRDLRALAKSAGRQRTARCNIARIPEPLIWAT